MSTIVLYCSPARGHLYPMVDVALALRDRGHRVVVKALASEANTLAAAGIEHRPIDPRIEALPLEDYKGANPLAQLRSTLSRWAERAPLEVEDLGASEADFLLVDANALGACASAEASKKPWAMFLPYCLPVPSRDAPAFGPGFLPPTGLFDRLRDDLVWWVQALAASGPLAPVAALRGKLGLPARFDMVSHFREAPCVIYRSAEPFDYPRGDWPANVCAVGPGLWAPPGTVPEWLAAMPRPRILVSVSTEFQDDGAIIEAALAGLGDQDLVVTTAAIDPARFTSPTARVQRFLPHAQVVPEVDLVVTHGGMGTTQRALAAGVPLVVVPWGRDQLESARRVEVAGAGVFLPRAKLSSASLAEAARRALAMKPGAERIAAAFRAAGGAARAADRVEAMLGQSAPQAASAAG